MVVFDNAPARVPRAALVLALLAGCSGETPAPTPLDDPKENRLGQPQMPPRPENPTLKNADLDRPGPRTEAQLDPEALEATLAEATDWLAKGETVHAINALRACANRDPISVRCDGRLGLLLAASPHRRAAATYFISEAAVVDEPAAPAELYADLAGRLRRLGKYEVAATALKFALARNDTAELHVQLSGALQSIPGRELEAADELAAARKLEPNVDILRNEATLRAQITSQLPRSVELFRELLEQLEDERKRELVESRIAQIEAQIAEDPEAVKRARAALEASEDGNAEGEPPAADPKGAAAP